MNITSLGYIGFESPNAKEWVTFGPEVFGLGLAEPGADGTVYLRMDHRHHRLAVHPGDEDRLAYIGWELRGPEAFTSAVDELSTAGVGYELGTDGELAERRVRALARFCDPAGFVHEVFWGATFTPGSFQPGKAMAGRFVAGTEGVGHIVVAVPEFTEELEHFATKVLGLRRYLANDTKAIAARGAPEPHFYRCNTRTHCFAYVGVRGMRGVQHICIEGTDLDDIGRAYDLVQEHQLPVTLSLGRHAMDTMISFYMRTPTGFDIEFGAGGELIDDTYVEPTPSYSEVWGHKTVTPGWAPTVRPVPA